MPRTIGFFVVATLLATTTVVQSHHAFSAEFDANLPIQVQGKVTRVQWINPHSWVHLDVTNEDGSVTSWMVEGGTPNTLLRRGFTKNSLLPGTEIVVDGYRAKDGSDKGNGRDLTFKDGRKLFLGSSGTGAPRDGRDQTEPSR